MSCGRGSLLSLSLRLPQKKVPLDKGFWKLGPMTSHQNGVSLRIGSVRTPSLLWGLPDVHTHGSLLDAPSRAGALPLSGWRRAASGQGLSPLLSSVGLCRASSAGEKYPAPVAVEVFLEEHPPPPKTPSPASFLASVSTLLEASPCSPRTPRRQAAVLELISAGPFSPIPLFPPSWAPQPAPHFPASNPETCFLIAFPDLFCSLLPSVSLPDCVPLGG